MVKPDWSVVPLNTGVNRAAVPANCCCDQLYTGCYTVYVSSILGHLSPITGQAYFWSLAKLGYVNRETVMKLVTLELNMHVLLNSRIPVWAFFWEELER
jgi:hypothetical protein